MTKKTHIRNTNQGQYFRLKDSENAPVWIRGEYNRSEGKYSCTRFDDANHESLMKPNRIIFIGFEF